MYQPLPYANFNVTDIALDSPTSYILAVDLEYPRRLHDAHVDLCSVRRDKPPNKWQDMLLATLYDKTLTHYRNLRQCVRHEL